MIWEEQPTNTNIFETVLDRESNTVDTVHTVAGVLYPESLTIQENPETMTWHFYGQFVEKMS